MKVAFLAPFKDGTGYSKAAIEYMLALDSVGVEVVPRSVKMTDTTGEIPERIGLLEDNDLTNIDAAIQLNLPDNFVYKGGIQNIGAFAYETSGFPNTNWIHHLKMMDKVQVFCSQQKHVVENESRGTIRKIYAIPNSVDTDSFHGNYDRFNFGTTSDTLKFYTISEFGRRKNIAALIAAYFCSFSDDDNVILIIKTHVPNRDSQKAISVVKEMCDDLKDSIGRFANHNRYPKILLLTKYMTDGEINSLHKSCDIFVSASHGESLCIPFIDAMGFGNPTIVPNHTAFIDYQYDQELKVESTESKVLGVNSAPSGLYTGDETWGNISILELSNTMKKVYLEQANYLRKDVKVLRFDHVRRNFARTVIGTKLKDMINAE